MMMLVMRASGLASGTEGTDVHPLHLLRDQVWPIPPDLLGPCPAKAIPQLFVGGKTLDRRPEGPGIVGWDQQTDLAVDHYVRQTPNRRGHDGDAGGHSLHGHD